MSVLWYSYWILVRLLVLWILDSGTVIGSGTFINFGVFWDLGTLITLVRLFDTLEYNNMPLGYHNVMFAALHGRDGPGCTGQPVFIFS